MLTHFQINTVTESISDFKIIECTGDVNEFAIANRKLLISMFNSDVSHITVGYDDPTKWCDFMKLKVTKPSIYNFITSKLQLSDKDISQVNRFIIDTANAQNHKLDTAKVSFLTDFICNVYLNQFDLQLNKQQSA